MNLKPNDACPCCSGRKFKKCCRLVVEGQPASSPEALMRSRYTAYALGRVEHILRTTHPAGPHWQEDHAAWSAEVQAFCDQATFASLEVRGAQAEADRGLVDFKAILRNAAGDEVVMAERSLFLTVGGQWRYHSGVRLDS